MNTRISIKADREYLREIFVKIENGRYAVPVFQRDFVWKPHQVVNLFDSILHGYPIGSLVLWQSDEVHQSKHILSDTVSNSPTPDYFILDGRQRLTTLYGVLSQNRGDARFNLFYNLEKSSFEFAQKEALFLVPVFVVYDTFSLLGWMQQIQQQVKDENKLRLYITRAKNLNSLLQEYIVSEILISQCDLNAASVVFSRINSTGTKIEPLDMLQAIKYKGDNSALITGYVQGVQKALESYDFQSLSPKDILNSCFWYTDRKYYDSKVEYLEKENLEVIFPKAQEAIIRAVRFLRNDCGVLSIRLLPYTKQLLALVWYFKDEDESAYWRRQELRRWFFFTTYKQLFMNGALQHIRSIHNRLELFIQRKSDTAWDYEAVERPFFGFKFSPKSALSRFMTLSVVFDMMTKGEKVERMEFVGYDHYFGASPLCYSPKILVDKKVKHATFSVVDWTLINSGMEKQFIERRKIVVSQLEKQLLDSIDIVFTDEKLS